MQTAFDSQITFFPTRDLDTTHRFYTELLGLRLALDQGGCRIYRASRSAYIGFCKRDAVPDAEGVVLTLVARNVDEWHARLAAQGVEFEKKPARNPTYKIYHCFFRDPNGYLLEIQRFENPAWDEG